MNPTLPNPAPIQQPQPNPTPVQPPASAGGRPKGMFAGRLNRIGYLLSVVCILAYFLILVGLVFLLRGTAVSNILAFLFGAVGVIACIPIGLSISIRRWHDMNQSGWMVLLGLIPFVGWFLWIVYLFVPGTKTANNYGEIDNRPFSIGKGLFGK